MYAVCEPYLALSRSRKSTTPGLAVGSQVDCPTYEAYASMCVPVPELDGAAYATVTPSSAIATAPMTVGIQRGRDRFMDISSRDPQGGHGSRCPLTRSPRNLKGCSG